MTREGQQLGNYRLIRLLGEGGFAEVYLGEHVHLNTLAAIKVLHTQLASDDEDKFRGEARTVARLVHPSIVRVLDFGIEGRTPFLVMDYAPNGTLRKLHSKNIPLSLSTILPYIKQIAEALQYAHDEKVIHRDVKPENMLVGRRNEILLSDFGIAVVAQSSRYQSTQDMSGTIAYMAPEQIQAHSRPASDQYSLGIVLYEWLSGNRPFHGTFTEIAIKHSIVPPPSLREEVPTISATVEQVVMKALAKDPKERFASIQTFAIAFEQACQLNAPSIITSVASPAQSSPIEAASNPFAKAPTVSPTQPALASLGAILFTYSSPSGAINALAWSPDGKRIAAGFYTRLVHILDGTTGNKILAFDKATGGMRGPCKILAWSPDGKYIVSSGMLGPYIWNTASGETVPLYYNGHGTKGLEDAVWSPNGRYIASASSDKTVQIWEAITGKAVLTYRDHSYGVHSVAWSPDGKRIASGSWQEVRVWDAKNGRSIQTYNCHSNDHVYALAWSSDGKHIASIGGTDRIVVVWDTITGKIVLTYRGHSKDVLAIGWSPNGKWITSSSRDETVQIWDAITGNKIYTYTGHYGAHVYSVAWSPDGERIASGDNKAVQVWQATF